MSDFNRTPSGNRIHIGIFGKTNSGKSSFINGLTKQDISIVSDVKGTTTDPVYKPMEINPLGACVIIDTAGFDDISNLGDKRLEKTKLAAQKTDIAVLIIDAVSMESLYKCSIEQQEEVLHSEKEWYRYFKENNVPVLIVLNKTDKISDISDSRNLLENFTKIFFREQKGTESENIITVSAKTGIGMENVRMELARLIPEDFEAEFITGNLVKKGDMVMLVMPQDIQAPKGRLILPQVQTIRELLDRQCSTLCVTTDMFTESLASLIKPPDLIITDSQVFDYVYKNKPDSSRLTSFSVLFAAYKGDINYYMESVKVIESLTEKSNILIAECCTHSPLSEDIGRVKIPQMLRNKIGAGLNIDVVSGTDFPDDLNKYDLIIQCGGCMFNKKYILSRINAARKKGVPMTNYGITIAYVKGILDKIVT